MTHLKVTIGGSLADDGAAFVSAWHAAKRGNVVHDHVVTFETWDGMARVMTIERVRLLRHLHSHPEPSISALARALGRQYRRVHDDVKLLENAGIVSRDGGFIKTMADKVIAELNLAA